MKHRFRPRPIFHPNFGSRLVIGFAALVIILLIVCFGKDIGGQIWAIAIVLNLARRFVFASTAEALMRRDRRAPVAYFRPFTADRFEWSKWNEEEALGEIFQQLGPFIALGRPGDTFQPPGAGRVYVPDQKWRSVVVDWLTKADLVVFRVGKGDALWWELSEAVRRLPPAKLLIYCETEQDSKELRRKSLSILPKPILEDLTRGGFFCFSDDWSPAALHVFRPPTWVWAWIRALLRLSTSPIYLKALKPFLAPRRVRIWLWPSITECAALVAFLLHKSA